MGKKQTIASYLQENIEDIIKYRKDGILVKDIAKIYNTSESSVTRALENNGVYTRNLFPKTKENLQLLIDEYISGKTLDEIANIYHVSHRQSLLFSMKIISKKDHLGKPYIH